MEDHNQLQLHMNRKKNYESPASEGFLIKIQGPLCASIDAVIATADFSSITEETITGEWTD